jgi:hypothetical protein
MGRLRTLLLVLFGALLAVMALLMVVMVTVGPS